MKMKKAIPFIMSLTLVGSCCMLNNTVNDRCSAITATMIVEQGTYEVDENTSFEYSVTENGDAYIRKYTGTAEEVVIPSEINGNKVTGIATWSFYNRADVTSVTIPEGIKSISMSAFEKCTGLTSITIPESVKEISRGLFTDCSNLKTVILPDSIKYIDYEAFMNCTSLESINIPDGLEYVMSDAFTNTKWYDEQPDGMMILGKAVYKYKGTMPENTDVVIPDGIKCISGKAFAGCTGMTSVAIPDSVDLIENDAFSGCSGLTEVTIPDSVWEMGHYVFEDCTGLTSVKLPEGIKYFAYGTLKGCTGLTSVTLPSSLLAVGLETFEGCTGLTSITIPDNVTDIMDNAFKDCTDLTKIVIPKNVSYIHESAFSGCTNLTIYGYKGSEAEKHANANNIKFVDLDAETTHQTTKAANKTTTAKSNSPKTGDKGSAGLVSAGIAASVLALVSFKKRKR